MAATPLNSLERRDRDRAARIDWICLTAAVVILIGLRLHAFDLPLETDECNYAYIAGRLLEGDRLYVDVWDHQPFGIFSLFAGVSAIFGDSPEVFRWLAAAFSLLSLVLIHAIVGQCAGRVAALVGALMFAIASPDPGTAGEGCNREIYMNTLILSAWFLALRPTRSPRATAFASGCALGVASTIKTIVAVHWIFLGVWFALVARRHGAAGSRPRPTLTSLVWFAAGPAVLWIAVFGYFAATQRLNEFVDAVFLFNLSYSGQSDCFLSRFIQFFTPERHPFIFDSAWPLWVGGAASVGWLIFEIVARRSVRSCGFNARQNTGGMLPRDEVTGEHPSVRGATRPLPPATGEGGPRAHGTDMKALAIVLLVVSSYLATCLPARFWPHYYYLMIPTLVISVAVALGCCAERLYGGSSAATGPARRGAVVLLYAIVPLGLGATEYRSYLSQPPFGITVTRYNSRDFWGRAHGENIRRVTEPDDAIFVFGNEAEIYYYAQRRCASRFTMITGIQSGYADSARRRATMLAELEQRLPRLILVVFDEAPFAEWKAFLDKYYGEPIGWDFHDRTGQPIMFVLARKDQPVESIDWNWDRKEVGGWQLGERR